MKEITIRNIEILTDLAPALQQFKSITLPGAITYCGIKSLKSCTDQLKIYDDARMQILNLFAKKDPEGNPVQVIDKGTQQPMFDFENEQEREKANKEIGDILNVEVQIKIKQVKMSDLKQVNINGELLERLISREFIIDDMN